MTVRSRGILGAAVSAAVLAAVVVAAFVGASLIGSGESDPPTLQELLDTTPAPPSSPYPTHDPSLPTQPADDTDRTPDPNATAPPFEIGGVSVPIPTGAQRIGIIGDPSGYPFWRIELDGSIIEFGRYGLTRAEIAPGDEDAFDPTLDAIWVVAQQNAEPSPSTVDVSGMAVSLPSGSYYSILNSPSSPDDPLYIVRLSHSVLTFDSSGVITKSIQAEDAGAFTSALTALLTTAE